MRLEFDTSTPPARTQSLVPSTLRHPTPSVHPDKVGTRRTFHDRSHPLNATQVANKMDRPASPSPLDTDGASSTKRKRSPSLEAVAQPAAPPAKTSRPNPSHLQINYLARLYPKILPLITPDDTLPTLLSIIGDYEGVLQRHESMAGNLGAQPLGPILIKRFERLFDGPPRVLKNHGKEGIQIGWLDVVDFARNKPDQFNLEKSREGVRVCQFYTKHCRVEISEEDYVLISSGMPQRLIPPQPIEEDEEKELGTLEILEKRMEQIVRSADHGMLLASGRDDQADGRSCRASETAESPPKEPSDGHCGATRD